VCITLISGNLALHQKKQVQCFQFSGFWSVPDLSLSEQDTGKNSWSRACIKVTGLVTEKLAEAGFEARDKGEFHIKKTFDMDTIVSEMRHYHNEGIEFRLDSEKVAIIRLRLERDFGRKCNNYDLFGLELHVDHIVPTPNDYSPGNLQLLCPRCHREVR